MRAANQLLKRVTGVRALVVEGKTRMLSVLQDLRYREATREAQVKVVLEGVAGYVNRLQKESRKWENLFGSECIVRKEVEARLVEEMGIRERLSTVVAEEREERQVLSGELTAVKSVQSQLSEKLADLVETCAIQFELSPEIVEELRGLLAALTLSPGDCAVGDFLNVLEDLKEGEIKKVYNELRGSFEEGKQALIEEAGHKAMLLDRAMEKQRNLEASVVALEKGLETRAGELRESQRTIDNLTELLHTGEAKAQDLEAARKADKAAYESEKVLVNRKLFDFAKCLMETFEFTEEAEEAEAIQTEFMRYFDAGNPNVSSDKFSALLEGCKSLAEDKVRKELKCLSDEGVDQVVRAGRLREEALLNQIKEMKESFSSLTEENESMKERYDALKTSNQSLLARLDISLSECKASQEENAFLRKEAELLRKQTEASSISACELNDLKTSLRMLVKTCSSKLSLGDEVEEAFETALETAISFGADYDWDTSSVVKALCDMKEYQTLTMESDMKSQFNVERSKLLKEIASQAELLDKFQRDVQLKETTNQVIQRDKDRYQQNLEETRAAMLENELSEAKKTSSAAERKSKKLQTSLKELEVQHTQTLTEHSQLEQDHKALLNQLNECQIELEHAKNSRGAGLMDETIFMQLQQAVEQKHQQLQALENEYRSLHANYSLVQSESQDLNSALAMMEMEKSHAVQELETLTERVNELEQEIEEARMQDEFLRARLAIFESQSLTEGSDSAGGNTLLSEVEDRRIKSECKFREMLKTLRTQNQEISQLKREKKELKNQLSLIDSTSHGLSEEQLKQHLSLISNVISGIKNRGDANDSSLTSQIGEEMNAEAYDLLKLELHEKILENEGLRREIRGLRIISLNEMSKVRTAEYSLSQHGRKVQQAESTISILKDKLSAKDCVEVEDVEMEVDDEEVFEVAKPEVKEKENKPKRDVLLPIALTNVIQTPIVQLQKQEQQQNAPINPNSRREKAAQKHKQVNVKNEEASDPNSCKTQ
ncbi:hypothetical protein BCR33DRAFT_479791 [Rhizoclosmatium globosum]|uniref:Uncharacterized protein n=1 Tax=Rhizoclosmatium globosum TaxID=329046 RepID=A0A1Y2BNH5_9FUNG|nr:hypothetical protein BCR33DRAFT_479791 [Rhizoclosmatium globosum]|eukprot:ORY36286.1 hypothetical protein BCR33DRAFT_479791 [Rhizoclosmatium globosum]